MKKPISSFDGARRGLLVALRALLRPVVRFCARHGLSLRDLTETAKVTFVEESARDLEASGQSPSASRISVLTGVHRADVARILSGDPEPVESNSILTRVVGAWRQNTPFVSSKGAPKPLSFEGLESEFMNLVRSVSKEISPYSVLNELERLGAVSFEKGKVSLVANEFIPKGDFTRAMYLVGDDVHHLIRAAEDNMGGDDKPPHLHLTTSYDNIITEALPSVRKWFMDEGAAFHARARRFLSRFDKDMNPKLGAQEGGGRAVVGMFSYSEEPAQPTPSTLRPSARRRKS